MHAGFGAIAFFTIHKIQITSLLLIFLFYYGFGKGGTMHEQVIVHLQKLEEGCL